MQHLNFTNQPRTLLTVTSYEGFTQYVVCWDTHHQLVQEPTEHENPCACRIRTPASPKQWLVYVPSHKVVDGFVPRPPIRPYAWAVPNLITSANAFNNDWKMAKKPASQMMSDIVESFINRSSIDGTSRVAIRDKELCSKGAAYCALASQMKMLREAASARRLEMKNQRISELRGYTGWYTNVGAHQK